MGIGRASSPSRAILSDLQAIWRVVSPLKGCRKWMRSGAPDDEHEDGKGEELVFLLGVPESPGIDGSGVSILPDADVVATPENDVEGLF